MLDSRRVLFGTPDAVVIHAFETYSLYTLLRSLRRARTLVVWNSDGPPPRPSAGLASRMLQYAVRRTDMFIPFSNFTATALLESFPAVDPDKVAVIHPGLPLASWPLREPREPGERFRLLFVGGEGERKGLDTLVDAFEARLMDTCSLHVMTQDWYLPATLKRRLQALPNVQLDLDRRATRDAYAAADAFVLPTNFDLSSWVTLEAMATGVPVVTTAVGGIPDIVRDDETGLIVPAKDPMALAAAVHRLMSDAGLRARLVVAARSRVEQYFDAERNTSLMLERIVRLVDERSGARQAMAGSPRK